MFHTVEVLAQLSLLFSLVVLVYQDFKSRSVSVVFLLALCLSVFATTVLAEGLTRYGTQLLINGMVLLLQFLLIWVYFCFRAKRIIFLVGTHIGLGDLLFLLAVSPFFSSYSFMVFMLVGLFFCILTYPLLLLFRYERLVPLAGIFSIVLLIHASSRFYLPSISDRVYACISTFLH